MRKRKTTNTQGQEATQCPLGLDMRKLRRAVLSLRAVNHVTRKQILGMLHQRGKLSVTDIYLQLRIEQSVASQHLAILRRAGIVSAQRTGKQIMYSLHLPALEHLARFTAKLTQ